MKRTTYCGQVNEEYIGDSVTLQGWVHSRRDHGGVLFVDLRDREGLVQLVFPPERKDVFDAAQSLKNESVIEIAGDVRQRPAGTENANLNSGRVEVWVTSVSVLNVSKTPPFEISEHSNVNEDMRLRHRYLDLRRPAMQKNLIMRHKATAAARDYLAKSGFLELETPFLTKSTPEGARDFLVPSRLSPGEFYALPQSPQLFKQLFMVAGYDRYYQVARCFRDEDLRADRQPEFTQVDIEMSFVDEDDIIAMTEGLIAEVFKAALGQEPVTPFPRLSYQDAMNRFGSDKPDMRYAMELTDVSHVFKNTGFKVFKGALDAGGVVKALCFQGGASLSRMDIDKLTEFVKGFGAKGLAWIKVTEQGPESSITKFFSSEELAALQEAVGARPGDIVFFGADEWSSVCTYLGALRVELAKRAKLAKPGDFKLLWVTDFPLFEKSADEGRWVSMHHPFTRPDPAGEKELLALASGQDVPASLYAALKARAYDVVMNGTELGGGSLRIFTSALQARVFELLKLSPESARAKFGFLLDALDFGAPPHGGIALGLDRFIALLAGEESIREVMAFPKTQKGTDPMTEAPSPVEPTQLRDLALKLNVPEAKPKA